MQLKSINHYPILSAALGLGSRKPLPLGAMIRTAERSDLPAMHRLGKIFGYTINQIACPQQFVVITIDAKIIGFARLQQHEDKFEGSCLGIDSAYRGHNLGQALTQELLRRSGGRFYINSIIPAYQHKQGALYLAKNEVPAFMVKDNEYCKECPKEQCRHMLYEAPDEIPELPNSRELNLRDQMMFRQIFEWDPSTSSALNFANLFKHFPFNPIRLGLTNGNLCVFVGEGETAPYFLQPIGEGPITDTLDACHEYFRQTNRAPIHYLLAEAFIKRHQLDQNPRYRVVADRDYADYVYSYDDLAALPGNQYRKQRDHINQLKRKHALEYNELTANNVSAFLEFVSRWALASKNKFKGISALEAKLTSLLANAHLILGLKGGCITIHGQMVAFAIGQALNFYTALIIAELADRAYPGAYQAINQLFCQNAWKGFSFINRQEDLGLERLRQTKLSYHPAFLAPMFDLRPVNNQ